MFKGWRICAKIAIPLILCKHWIRFLVWLIIFFWCKDNSIGSSNEISKLKGENLRLKGIINEIYEPNNLDISDFMFDKFESFTSHHCRNNIKILRTKKNIFVKKKMTLYRSNKLNLFMLYQVSILSVETCTK